MNKQDVLKAFADLSPEDQEAIRREIAEGEAEPVERRTFGPMAMCQEIMEKMKAGGDPMAICKEMMGKMEGKCC